MTGTLLVTPEELISTAGEFATAATNVQTLTQNMLDIVNQFGTHWMGEASNAYTTKFKSLESDMTKMYRMVTEHSKDLTEMAQNYKIADQTNEEAANALQSNAIS